MPLLIKQSTAATLTIGPFLDITDGVTPEVALAAGSVDEIGVYKHGATALTDISGDTTFTHRAGGTYTITLDTGDTDTVGLMRLLVRDDSEALPVWMDLMVLPANVYDSLIGGTDLLDTNVAQWLGTAVATPTTGGVPEVDLTHIAGAIVNAATAQLGVNVAQISGDGPAADNMESDYDGAGYNKSNSTIGTTTTNTDMRGTDNAALASVLGALADAAADGDPTAADTLMQYVKQLINVLVGTAGVVTFPAAAAPGNGVSLAEVLRAAYDDTNSLDGTKVPDTVSLANIQGEVDTALATYDAPTHDELVGLVQLLARSDAAINADRAAELTLINTDEGTGAGDYDNQSDAVEALRDRGDAAWVTGGGGALTQIINPFFVVPISIDLADTTTVRFGIQLVNSVDDLPSAAEITPGTITIARKAIGGGAWLNVVAAAAMSEIDGLVYYDEVFDSGSTYAEGDSIRVQFEGVSVTADANTYEVTGASGFFFQTYIRQTMRGTDSALLAANVPTNFTDLSITAGTGRVDVGSIEGSDATDQIRDAILDDATRFSGADLAAILTDTGTTIPALIAALNNISAADVLTQVLAALNTAIPGGPTADSINERVAALDDLLEAGGAGDATAILTDTGTTLPGLIAALNDISAADVNAQMVDVMEVDTHAQPGQGTPAATTTYQLMLLYLYKFLRNQVTQDATTFQVFNDDAVTVDQKATISDAAGTFTKGEIVTGP